MARLGLIHNPRSHRNKSRALAMAELEAQGALWAAPDDIAALDAALERFAASQVEILAIDGGDGTVRETLAALARRANPSRFAPKIVVMAAGKTNLAAADLGGPGYGRKGLHRFLALREADAAALPVQRRALIRVRWLDGTHPDLYGLFMGGAAFARGTELANSGIHQAGLTQGLAVAVAMFGVLLPALLGALLGYDRRGWLSGEPMCISPTPPYVPPADAARSASPAEGQSAAEFLFLATSLDRLILGLWPFWGVGRGALRYLAVAARPPGLLAALPRLMRGKPSQAMLASGAYRSGRAEAVRLDLQSPFIMDGEAYPPGMLLLTTDHHVDFIDWRAFPA
jgi:Diacylglycerol kinase catalytic domain